MRRWRSTANSWCEYIPVQWFHIVRERSRGKAVFRDGRKLCVHQGRGVKQRVEILQRKRLRRELCRCNPPDRPE